MVSKLVLGLLALCVFLGAIVALAAVYVTLFWELSKFLGYV